MNARRSESHLRQAESSPPATLCTALMANHLPPDRPAVIRRDLLGDVGEWLKPAPC